MPVLSRTFSVIHILLLLVWKNAEGRYLRHYPSSLLHHYRRVTAWRHPLFTNSRKTRTQRYRSVGTAQPTYILCGVQGTVALAKGKNKDQKEPLRISLVLPPSLSIRILGSKELHLWCIYLYYEYTTATTSPNGAGYALPRIEPGLFWGDDMNPHSTISVYSRIILCCTPVLRHTQHWYPPAAASHLIENFLFLRFSSAGHLSNLRFAIFYSGSGSLQKYYHRLISRKVSNGNNYIQQMFLPPSGQYWIVIRS